MSGRKSALVRNDAANRGLCRGAEGTGQELTVQRRDGRLVSSLVRYDSDRP